MTRIASVAPSASSDAPARERFALPDGVVYLAGNSLGPLQSRVAERVRTVVECEWGQGLVGSWNTATWLDLSRRAATRIARIVGADPEEVTVTDSTSVDLYAAIVAGARLRPDRPVVLVEREAFPTDRYVAERAADAAARRLRAVPAADLVHALDDEIALAVVSDLDFATGARRDLAADAARAREVGALLIADLSHTAGAAPVDLDGWGVDLAVGCTYKYLNGGPGAPAYLFVAARLHDRIHPAIGGWFGHERPFAFEDAFVPAPGAVRFRNGTPPVLSLTALDAALEVWDDVEVGAVTDRARALVADFLDRVSDLETTEGPEGLEVVTPRDPDRRGAQVTLRHPDAGAITRALVDRGVIVDHRPPDLVRTSFSPLFVSDGDVEAAATTLRDLLASGDWRDPRYADARVVP